MVAHAACLPPPSRAAQVLMSPGDQCFRGYGRRNGERRRKSVRGCIVSQDLSVLNLVIVKKGGCPPGWPRTHTPSAAATAGSWTRAAGCPRGAVLCLAWLLPAVTARAPHARPTRLRAPPPSLPRAPRRRGRAARADGRGEAAPARPQARLQDPQDVQPHQGRRRAPLREDLRQEGGEGEAGGRGGGGGMV